MENDSEKIGVSEEENLQGNANNKTTHTSETCLVKENEIEISIWNISAILFKFVFGILRFMLYLSLVYLSISQDFRMKGVSIFISNKKFMFPSYLVPYEIYRFKDESNWSMMKEVLEEEPILIEKNRCITNWMNSNKVDYKWPYSVLFEYIQYNKKGFPPLGKCLLKFVSLSSSGMLDFDLLNLDEDLIASNDGKHIYQNAFFLHELLYIIKKHDSSHFKSHLSSDEYYPWWYLYRKYATHERGNSPYYGFWEDNDCILERYSDFPCLKENHSDDSNEAEIKLSVLILQLGSSTRIRYQSCGQFLLQVSGYSSVVLFPPWQQQYLYLYPSVHRNRFTSQINLGDPELLNDRKYVKYLRGGQIEMESGNVLYIPPLWAYSIASLSFSSFVIKESPKNERICGNIFEACLPWKKEWPLYIRGIIVLELLERLLVGYSFLEDMEFETIEWKKSPFYTSNFYFQKRDASISNEMNKRLTYPFLYSFVVTKLFSRISDLLSEKENMKYYPDEFLNPRGCYPIYNPNLLILNEGGYSTLKHPFYCRSEETEKSAEKKYNCLSVCGDASRDSENALGRNPYAFTFSKDIIVNVDGKVSNIIEELNMIFFEGKDIDEHETSISLAEICLIDFVEHVISMAVGTRNFFHFLRFCPLTPLRNEQEFSNTFDNQK